MHANAQTTHPDRQAVPAATLTLSLLNYSQALRWYCVSFCQPWLHRCVYRNQPTRKRWYHAICTHKGRVSLRKSGTDMIWMCKIETAPAQKADRSSQSAEKKKEKHWPSPWRLSLFLGEQKILGDNKQGVFAMQHCTVRGWNEEGEWVGNGIARGVLLQTATIKSQPTKISG